MKLKAHWRVIFVYLILQAIIWAKAFYFFQQYGYGQISMSTATVAAPIILFDFIFHTTMSVLIAGCAFFFGRSLKNIDDKKLISVVLVAVFIHNFAYWFTNVFESAVSIIFDFIQDAVVLFSFIIASKYLSKKYAFFRNLKIPFLQ